MTVQVQSTEIETLLLEGARQLGLLLSKSDVVSMMLYMDILSEWNARTNLTSLTDNLDIIILHFLDSLTVFKMISHGYPMKVLDIGSGAGFPGMVLRIVDPSKKISLLDKNSKKIVFLKHVTNRLGLTDVEFLNIDYRSIMECYNKQFFDVVVARGFSSDHKILDSFAQFLTPSGVMIQMAGPSKKIESGAFQFFELSDIWEGLLPFSSYRRKVVRYEKII